MRVCTAVITGALVLMIVGCATQRATIGEKTVSSDQVHEIVQANQLRMQTAKGEGTISVETPSLAQSGSFVLTLKRPDSLLVNLKGPFGIKVGSALFTRSQFLFYNSLENRLFSGETTPANLSRVLRVDISFDDLLSLFTGGIFLDGDNGPPEESGAEDNQFTLVYRARGATHKYFIDPATLLITKIESLDDQGRLQLEQRFVSFQNVDSALVPFNIRIIQPKERRMVSVVYSDLSFSAQNLVFTFTYPKSAQRVRWQ